MFNSYRKYPLTATNKKSNKVHPVVLCRGKITIDSNDVDFVAILSLSLGEGRAASSTLSNEIGAHIVKIFFFSPCLNDLATIQIMRHNFQSVKKNIKEVPMMTEMVFFDIKDIQYGQGYFSFNRII